MLIDGKEENSNSKFLKTETETSGSDDDTESIIEFKPFTPKLSPRFVEHISYIPSYPKTHTKGYAIVVELPETMDFSKEKFKKLRQSMQYTLTGGGGDRKIEHVPYFENEGDDTNIPMLKAIRQCAGVKVFHHLKEEK